jgi:hypothetical protein
VRSAAGRPVYKAFVMQDKAEVDQKLTDAELLALVSKAQEEIEAHGGVNEANLLLRNFARELLKKRLRMMRLIRP